MININSPSQGQFIGSKYMKNHILEKQRKYEDMMDHGSYVTKLKQL